MFCKSVTGAAAALVFSSSVFAADLTNGLASLKDAPMLPVTPPWSGFYFGAHLGGIVDDNDNGTVNADFDVLGEGTFDDQNLDNYLFEDDRDNGRFIGGLHAGYNWQRAGSPFVLGVEGDLDFGDRIDWLASLRGRIGFGTERALLYATAGIAFADFSDDRFDVTYIGPRDDILFFDRSDDDESHTGWVAGLGAEFKLAQNVSLGIEGLYYGFGEDDSSVTFIDLDDQTDELATFSRDRDRDFWQVRGRLTYHVSQTAAPLR